MNPSSHYDKYQIWRTQTISLTNYSKTHLAITKFHALTISCFLFQSEQSPFMY